MHDKSIDAPSTTNSDINEEISLKDIARFLKEGSKWILLTTVICTFLGAIYALTAPVKYEGSANIEMAKIDGKPVEIPAILAEKLKLPLFYSSNTFKVCQVENARPSPGQFLVKELKPFANKNAPIVSIKFKGATPDVVRDCLVSVLADVITSQNVILKPAVDARKSELLALRQKLEASEKLITLLPVKDGKFTFDESKFSASALLLATLLSKENEITELRNKINDLEIALAEPQTKNASLVTPIYVPNNRVEPRSALIIFSMIIAGFFIGILIFWVRKTLTSQH